MSPAGIPAHADCHNFGTAGAPDSTFGFTYNANQTILPILNWAEAWNGVHTDLDMYLLNTATNTVKTVEGMIDKQTQRAAWTVAGESRPLMECGVANLTHDSCPALVHFPDDSTQQCLMVRLDKPGSTTKQQPAK